MNCFRTFEYQVLIYNLLQMIKLGDLRISNPKIRKKIDLQKVEKGFGFYGC